MFDFDWLESSWPKYKSRTLLCNDLSNIIGQFERYWDMIGQFERYWDIIGQFERYWDIIGQFERYWDINFVMYIWNIVYPSDVCHITVTFVRFLVSALL